ncbi:MAG: GGDEF domain-containing protein [Gemmatimonadetes bacterium]|nr:GGDEF domain-containing protein [Gemmatimonadota bacterium]
MATATALQAKRPIWYLGQRIMPRSAAALCFVALLIPAFATLAFPEELAGHEFLVWLVLLIPAFLLAYFRGWRGVATALAAGMATLVGVQITLAMLGRSFSNWPILVAVIIAYVLITLGIGFLSDRLHEERMRAEELALTDELTNLPNRRHVRLILDREVAAAARGRPIVVVLFDLDGFKNYNDRHGHTAGDEALRTFSSVLSSQTRAMNISARWGGEEFISVLSASDLAGALVFVERVKSRLRDMPPAAGSLTASAGLAGFHAGMRSPEDLLAAADLALYQAKRAGRDSVRVFQPALAERRA